MGEKFFVATENRQKGGETWGNGSGGPIFYQKKLKGVSIDSKRYELTKSVILIKFEEHLDNCDQIHFIDFNIN